MIYYCQYHSPRTGGSNPCPAYISLEQGQQRIADPEFPYKSDFVFFAGDFYPDTNKIYHNLEYYLQDRIQKATLQMKNILECIADINDKFVEPDDKLPVAGLTEIYYYRVAGGFLHNAYTVFEKKMPVEKITEKMIYFKEGLRGKRTYYKTDMYTSLYGSFLSYSRHSEALRPLLVDQIYERYNNLSLFVLYASALLTNIYDIPIQRNFK